MSVIEMKSTDAVLEKIEVRKSAGVFYYTGEVSDYDEENIIIRTIKGETIIFRKDQIEGRQVMSEKQRGETKWKPES